MPLYHELCCYLNFVKILIKGLNESQAATIIQKNWKGYVRRKIYNHHKNRPKDEDSDFEDVDIDILILQNFQQLPF